jgi:hypothetical protein
MSSNRKRFVAPMSDVDRAEKCYKESLGVSVDVDHRSNNNRPTIRPVISENCSRRTTVEKCELAQLLR